MTHTLVVNCTGHLLLRLPEIHALPFFFKTCLFLLYTSPLLLSQYLMILLPTYDMFYTVYLIFVFLFFLLCLSSLTMTNKASKLILIMVITVILLHLMISLPTCSATMYDYYLFFFILMLVTPLYAK